MSKMSSLSFCKTALAVLVFSIFLMSGCSATHPTSPHGVLSTIHQKGLDLSANRAMDQAAVNTEAFGDKKVHIRFVDVHDSDLGKQHVRRIVEDRIRLVSATVVDDPANADRELACQILLAGVDVSTGAFFGFSWIDTKSEVGLRFRDTSKDNPLEKEGSGTATYSQVWWIGIGPSETLK